MCTSAVDAQDTVSRFAACVSDIEKWMNSNRLKLNADKTKIIWIGSRQQLAKLDPTDVTLHSTTVTPLTTVVDLGVHVDNQLTMTAHVTHLSRSCFYQLRQLRSIRRFITSDAALTLVHIFYQ
jgi:hypothetical protein